MRVVEHVETLLALAAADDLADAGDEAVRRRDGLAVVVHAHVESLDVLGVIGDEDGLFEHFLGQVALMLGLKIDAPLTGYSNFLPLFLSISTASV